MEPKVILAALVIIIVLATILYHTVFKKSEEPEPEIVIEEELEEELEEVTEPSPDTIDDVMTGGDDEPVPDEDETSLETAPADGEVEDETVNEDVVVEGYMLKK
jgi:hypothetical protein|tara:strand:- start:220 stop:531 length:312 start_codon:yes stop_codon:yes gene_type:complete